MAPIPLEPESLPTLLAGLGLVGLAAWLHFLPPANRSRRAFALLAFLRGVLLVTAALAPRGALLTDLSTRVALYLYLAIPFAAVHFAVTYAEPSRRRPGLTALLVAGAVLAQLSYFAQRDAWMSVPGPVFVLFPLEPLSYLLVAAWLAHVHDRDPLASRAPSTHLVSLGFALEGAYLAALHAAVQPGPPVGEHPWWWIEWSTWSLAALLAVGLVAWRLAVAHGSPFPRRLRRYAAWLLAPLVTGAAAGLVNRYDVLDPYLTRVLLDAAWILAFVLLVAYALLRYRLFDLDIKVKWTLRQGTLAAIFVAVFFGVSEGAALAFENWSGSPALGIAAAALLLFALTPLQGFAENVANRAMPHARPVAQMRHEERIGLYQAMVRAAWQDGQLSLAERRVLDVGRERLGLDPVQATKVERDVTSRLSAPRRRRGADA